MRVITDTKYTYESRIWTTHIYQYSDLPWYGNNDSRSSDNTHPSWTKVLRSISRAVVGDHADQGEEVVGTARVLLHLLVHPLCDVGGQDLHQGGRRQSPHRVVLDRTPWQVGVRDEGKVVDGPDQDAQVLFVVVGKHQLLEMLKLGGIDRPVPLELVLALLDHRPQLLVLVHPGGEGLLVAARSVLQGIGGEADEVEVALHEVQDKRLPGDLLVLGGHVVLPLGLDDALPQVLNARALGEGSANIDHRSIFFLPSTVAGTFSSSSLMTSNSPLINGSS